MTTPSLLDELVDLGFDVRWRHVAPIADVVELGDLGLRGQQLGNSIARQAGAAGTGKRQTTHGKKGLPTRPIHQKYAVCDATMIDGACASGSYRD